MQRRGRTNITFTRHAESRLVDREITRAQVTSVLINPREIVRNGSNNNFRCFGTPDDIPYPDEPFLVVIYEQRNTQITVITVMWQSRGGLIANGFNTIR